MSYTLNNTHIELKQLDNCRKKYALEIFDGKVTDIFSFIELRSMPKIKNDKYIIDNVIKLNMDINSFIETLSFLEEENCLTINRKQNKQQIKYFEKSDGLREIKIFDNPEYKDLPYLDISIDKRKFKRLKKRKYLAQEYYFEKSKDKKNISLSEISILIAILAVIITLLLGIFK